VEAGPRTIANSLQYQSIETAEFWQHSSFPKTRDYAWESNRIYNGLNSVFPIQYFLIYDDSSSLSADDYIIDADRSTLRLSTGYPFETCL
jgi:hypothetical protein